MRFFRHRLAVPGLVGLMIIFGAGIFANFIAPYTYSQIDLDPHPAGPVDTRTTSARTHSGRDEYTRVLYGIRTSMEVGVFVAVVSTLIGLVIGAVAGYYGGWMDNLLMRVTDLVLTLPLLVILLTAATLLGEGNQWRVSIILVLFFWTGIARVVRGIFLSLREKEYVEAAKASGAGDARLMFRHILPNTLGPIVVNATLAVGTAILIEAALSFLGFGIKPPTPSLGGLVNDAAGEPGAVVADHLPGPDDRPHRPLRQLRRRRPAGRARSAAEEGACLSRFSRSGISSSSSRPRTGSSTPWTASRTTSSPARRSGSSASRAPARASRRSRCWV